TERGQSVRLSERVTAARRGVEAKAIGVDALDLSRNAGPARHARGCVRWKARSVSRSRPDVWQRTPVSPPRKGETVEVSWHWRLRTRASTTWLCKSVGRGGRWPSLFRNSKPLTQTTPPRKPSAIGTTGGPQGYCL